ncbi:hypothetical protein FQN54_005571 [Arachnomyces sp. PD_36]|nr:hypothetical protein FQN54_005571 [Arachnomyces sp. PD_36]
MARPDRINIRICICFLLIPTFFIYTWALSRSLSETGGVPQFFMADLYSHGTVEQVTFGYFGLCHLSTKLSESPNTCIRVAGLPKGSLSEHLKLENTDAITEDLLESGLSLTSRVLCPIFAATGLLFLCGTLAFLLLEVVFSEKEDMDKVTALTRQLRWLRTLTLTILLIVCAMGFVVVSTIAIAATGMHFEIQGSDDTWLVIVPGKTLRILQWFTLSFSGLIAVGVVDLLRAKRRPAEPTRASKAITESYSDL